jgi:tRNA A37 threonylcarbamoyladenosine modification protein TsaB
VICAFIQAGRGRYNWVGFAAEDEPRRPTADQHLVGDVKEFVAALAAHSHQLVWLVGETTPELADAMAELPHVHLLNAISSLRRAGHLARLAALYFARGEEDDLDTLQPLYLRNPEWPTYEN